ncbi:MAG: hypothetical protein HY321_17115 [Armatimonadetes bacterium]|nr:hypothetical protein [Armatimonadota bacterium]
MRSLFLRARPMSVSWVFPSVIVSGLCAGSAVAAEPAATATVAANPVVLYIGNSHTGHFVPDLVAEMAAATTPPITVVTREHLRGSHALSDHWQRPQQPQKFGHVLSWLRYPDPPKPSFPARTLAEWGDRRADLAVLQPFHGEQYDEETLHFWVRLFHRPLVQRGIKPVLYVSHGGRPGSPHNFMFPFKSEAEALETLSLVNTACLRVATELDSAVAPSYLACYNAKRARPDLDLAAGSPDNSHAGYRCYYLQACTVYAALFNRSPEGLPVRAVRARDGKGLVLTDDEALFLQKTAWESVQEFRRMAGERRAALAAGKAPALARKPRILVIGAPYDDRTQLAPGKWVSGFRTVLRERVKAQLGMDVVFAPLGPCSAVEALSDLDDWLGDQKWALVAFAWGARELAEKMPLEGYERNLRALLGKLRQNGSPLFWMGILPVTPKPEAPGVAAPPLTEMMLTAVTNIAITDDAGPLTETAERVVKEYGLSPDTLYARHLSGFFAPGGQPVAREITKADWAQLAEWLGESLERQVNAAAPEPSPGG